MRRLIAAEVLRIFLALITNGQLPTLPAGLPHIAELLSFCKKYDCVVAKRSALLSIRELVILEELSYSRAMKIGALADDVNTCVVSLKCCCDRNPNNAEAARSFLRFKDCPLEYSFALARAGHNVKYSGEDGSSLGLCAAFKRLVLDARSKSSDSG